MLDHSRVATLVGTAHVAGHPLAAVQNFHGARCDAQLQRQTHDKATSFL
jgi:hypothetical protein